MNDYAKDGGEEPFTKIHEVLNRISFGITTDSSLKAMILGNNFLSAIFSVIYFHSTIFGSKHVTMQR